MSTRFLITAFAAILLGSIADCAEEYQKVFPKVKIEYPSFMQMFSEYAKEQKLKPLQANHLRLFIQPLGIFDSVFDVDLTAGSFIRYPGTHDEAGIQNGKLSEKDVSVLLNLVKSKEFQKLPEQILKMGLDGCNIFVEVEWGDHYFWRLRWEPDEPSIREMERILKSAAAPK